MVKPKLPDQESAQGRAETLSLSFLQKAKKIP